VKTEKVVLPGGSPTINYTRQTIFCTVDLPAKTNRFDSEFLLSGGMSTKYRTLFSYLENNKEVDEFYRALYSYQDIGSAFRIDSVVSREFRHDKPFRYRVKAKGVVEKGINILNDSILNISFSDLFMHDQVEIGNDSTELGFYLDYTYSDVLQLFITFSQPVEVVNRETFGKSLVNDVGEYTCSLSIINPAGIMVSSTYTISKDAITGSDCNKLTAINNLLREAKNTRLIIKVLPEEPGLANQQ